MSFSRYLSKLGQLLNSSGQVTAAGHADGSVSPVKLSTGAPTWDTSGNAGLNGVSPSAWNTDYKVMELATFGSLFGRISTNNAGYAVNAYRAASGAWTYKNSGAAARYEVDTSTHYFYSAPSGTAGNPITWTQVLAIDKGRSLALEGASPQVGVGITFPATQNASSDANTLDDYEEGTWTPTCVFSSGTLSSYAATGIYTKVGRLVTVHFDITIITGTSGAGNVTVSGLPFTASTFVNTSGNGREYNNTGKALGAYLSNNSNSLSVYFYDNSFCGANGNRLAGFLTYFV